RRRLLHDERIGAAFDEQIAVALRADHAAQLLLLHHRDRPPGFAELVGAREPGDSAADDDDLLHKTFPAAEASASMSNGSAFGIGSRSQVKPSASACFRWRMSRS